jgi:hypothetical protein
MASLALTAPDSMGFMSGSTLYGGFVSGYNNSVLGSGLGNSQWNLYLGATVATPVTGLRMGAAFDYLGSKDLNRTWLTTDLGPADLAAEVNVYAAAVYMSYQATEKLSLHGRAEYLRGDLDSSSTTLGFAQNAGIRFWALTGTAQYDLWKNVLSRVELRWDHSEHGKPFGGTAAGGPDRENAFMLAGNVIYKF